MKVLIIGSFYPPDPPLRPPKDATAQQVSDYEEKRKKFESDIEEYKKVRKPQFRSACYALGAAFARKAYPIRVGVTSWEMLQDGNTVGSWAPLGANSVAVTDGRRHVVIFDAPQEPEPPDSTAERENIDTLRNFRDELHNIDLQEKFIRKSRYRVKDRSSDRIVDTAAGGAADKTTDSTTDADRGTPPDAPPGAIPDPTSAVTGATPGTTSITSSSETTNRGAPTTTSAVKATDRFAERVRMIPNVTEVDAVVLVGGTYGTSTIGYAAYSMNKPVIAITSFGGAAREIADDILFDEYNRFVKHGDMTAAEVRALGASWNQDFSDKENHANADLIVHATESMAKAYGRTNRKSLDVLLATTIGMAVLLIAWILVYLSGTGAFNATTGDGTAKATGTAPTLPPTAVSAVLANEATKSDAAGGATAVSPTPGQATQAGATEPGSTPDSTTSATTEDKPWKRPLAFFLLLYISALLGAGLRTLASYQNSEVTQLTFLGLWIDAVVSLIVAFGLALLYLIGSISFTGEVVVLTGSEAFANIAVSMSLLGLAAGYVVPLNRLRERLEKIVAEEE